MRGGQLESIKKSQCALEPIYFVFNKIEGFKIIILDKTANL